MLRTGQPQAEEAMSAILRDKINELLTENANLEREVERLREAERKCLGDTSVATENTPRDIIATDTDSIEEVRLGVFNSAEIFISLYPAGLCDGGQPQ